jgi:hypothetical protein
MNHLYLYFIDRPQKLDLFFSINFIFHTMKKLSQILVISFLGVWCKCSKRGMGYSNWLNNWTEFRPNKLIMGSQSNFGCYFCEYKVVKENVYRITRECFQLIMLFLQLNQEL